jgi:MFS family permease
MLGKTGVAALHGRWLMAAITSVCSSGFLLFGYDQGVMSGVVLSQNWLDKMGNPSSLIIGTIVASYDIGAVIGAVMAAFVGDPLGRKRTLILGAATLLIGSVLMGSSFEQGQFIVGRILTGIGIGIITSVTPVYQSEVSKATHRGWHVCCQLTTLLFGLMLAYFINYGFFFHKSDIQWRFPLLFQIVFAAYILLLTPFLPDTPRWLMRHEDVTAGSIVLARLRNRGEDDNFVKQEKAEILEAIKIETEEEGSWLDLFRSHGIQAHKRFYLSLGIQFMQQMTG